MGKGVLLACVIQRRISAINIAVSRFYLLFLRAFLLRCDETLPRIKTCVLS